MIDWGQLFRTAVASVITGGLVAALAREILKRGIDYRLRLAEMRTDIIWENEISYRKAQLAELYGPVYSMLKTSGGLYRLWRSQQLCGVNLQVKRYFAANNDAIRRLLIEKMHLVEGGEIPSSFMDFMTSAMIWNWYCAGSDEGAIPDSVAGLPEAKWPQKFEEHVFQTTEKLKGRLNDLYAEGVTAHNHGQHRAGSLTDALAAQ